MNKGKLFEKDGEYYEILQVNITLTKHNPPRIQRQGDRKFIPIQEALMQGLIGKVTPTENIGLFSHAEQLDPEKIEEKGDIAEPHPPKCLDTPKIRSVSDNIYFMPVDRLRAQVFLAHGLIYPDIYDKAESDKDFHDSQRQNPVHLMLYANPHPLNHDQFLLKIFLHPNEIAKAERNGDILYLAIPLPISRLAGIEIPAAADDLDRCIKGLIKPDVPVPRHLFTNEVTPSSPDQEKVSRDSLHGDAQPDPNIAESIRQFDRYLGVMAFLRNADRYFSEKTGNYADYPEVFFAVCERIMDKSGLAPAGYPEPDPLLLALLGFDTPEMPKTTRWILDLVNSQASHISEEKDDEAYKLAKEIYNQATISKEIIKEAFSNLFNSKDYQSAISKLQGSDIPIEAAVLAGLLQSSVRQSHGYRSVKQLFHEDWSNQNQARLVLATLGAYYGYTALDAQEAALYSVHPLIRPLIEKYPEIKFHLRTRFERELIESLYQRAFFPNQPVRESDSLFNTVITAQPVTDLELSELPICASTYTVQDLVVRQYKITSSENSKHAPVQDLVVPQDEIITLEKFSQQLKLWKGNTILQINFKKENQNLVIQYSITKDEFIELIENGTITFKEDNTQ
ncbi:MAG: hypothetical protein QG599_2035 [Pseudomonadota bacterium]|nr:hypothetical protein [Pseudomonadota bacterium]